MLIGLTNGQSTVNKDVRVCDLRNIALTLAILWARAGRERRGSSVLCAPEFRAAEALINRDFPYCWHRDRISIRTPGPWRSCLPQLCLRDRSRRRKEFGVLHTSNTTMTIKSGGVFA